MLMLTDKKIKNSGWKVRKLLGSSTSQWHEKRSKVNYSFILEYLNNGKINLEYLEDIKNAEY
jgi:hypothetical protein